MPAISVIVATYQRPVKLKRALLSVLNQTFKDYDVKVVHDGPPEADTVAVCEELSSKFEDIGIPFALASTDTHSGYYTQPRNFALYYSKGDYIANLDDDNEWLPDHLERLYAAIREGESWPDFVYARREYVAEDGYPTPEGIITPSPLVEWKDESMARLAVGPMYNFIDSGDFLAARGAYYRLAFVTGKCWNEAYRRFGDWELLTRAAFFGDWRGKAVDAVTHRYYIHGQNVSLTRPVKESPTTVGI